MDPITHGVIGMTLSKVTGNEISVTDAATAAVVVGSVFPDIDIVFQKWGDCSYLKNHRGVTHSIIGLLTSSVFIAFLLNSFYSNASFMSLVFWALLGGISHTFFDLFNSYGAKLLWPFINKKYSFGLLLVFDPIFLISMLGYIFTSGVVQKVFIISFLVYLLSRVVMRMCVFKHLKKKFKKGSEEIFLVPAMTGLFRWHFILEEDTCSIFGEKNIFRRNIKIIEKLNKIQDELLETVSDSSVGKFFAEFTPVFHVNRQLIGGITRYTFIDMRYYMRNDFLHHAILEVDKSGRIITSSFNPYSINRASDIPEEIENPKNNFFTRLRGV
ncbi:metal-dependent hydrolase [Herbivorax sp. ANBcel31]|uniref:metal-dependent hydrolase n=1 Tax=Herbivorax sp. ANBcel31 TaxID=3069754 RepID=UPI0027B68072|nr:metal-dependent hydrolase [Herbivorax sp. ANBcel31]MDQ2086081.1 metal-dependent hydrolase [Herbivorax sp. ANBcel31]